MTNSVAHLDDRTISLNEASTRLGAPGVAANIVGASERFWQDVVIERWLTLSEARADVMGALTDPARFRSSVDHQLPWATVPVVAEWLRIGDPLPSSVLWFEWDRPQYADPLALARPLVSVCVSDVVLGAIAHRRVPTDAAARARLIDRTLTLFDESQARTSLTALMRRLPAHAELTHLAGLRPRSRGGVRVVIWMIAAKVEGWLRTSGWPGPIDAVRPLLSASAAPFRNVGMQLELCDGELGPYLGLETPEYFFRPTAVQFRRWVELLRSFGAAVDDRALDRLRVGLRPGQQTDWHGPDRLYLKAAYDGHWHAKSYVAAGPTSPPTVSG